jgi:hypothetical protein
MVTDITNGVLRLFVVNFCSNVVNANCKVERHDLFGFVGEPPLNLLDYEPSNISKVQLLLGTLGQCCLQSLNELDLILFTQFCCS